MDTEVETSLLLLLSFRFGRDTCRIHAGSFFGKMKVEMNGMLGNKCTAFWENPDS